MPKLKTNRAAAKRFKATGTGKIKRMKAGKQHILTILISSYILRSRLIRCKVTSSLLLPYLQNQVRFPFLIFSSFSETSW